MASPTTSLAISWLNAPSDGSSGGFCFAAPLFHPCSRTATMRASSARGAIRDRGMSTGGSISSAMVRSAAAADWEFVISLISFTPPQTQAAASTHRFPPAARCAEIMASSPCAARSTSPSISASSLKFNISSFRFELSAINIRQRNRSRPAAPCAVGFGIAIGTAKFGGAQPRRLHGCPPCPTQAGEGGKRVAGALSRGVTHETQSPRREAPVQTVEECSTPTLVLR